MAHGPRSRATKVNIMGQDYVLSGDIDPDYMNKVAHYVNSKMKELHERTVGMSMTRLAVLAALNIADEMITLRSDSDAAETLGAERIEHIEGRIGTWLRDLEKHRTDSTHTDRPL